MFCRETQSIINVLGYLEAFEGGVIYEPRSYSTCKVNMDSFNVQSRGKGDWNRRPERCWWQYPEPMWVKVSGGKLGYILVPTGILVSRGAATVFEECNHL